MGNVLFECCLSHQTRRILDNCYPRGLIYNLNAQKISYLVQSKELKQGQGQYTKIQNGTASAKLDLTKLQAKVGGQAGFQNQVKGVRKYQIEKGQHQVLPDEMSQGGLASLKKTQEHRLTIWLYNPNTESYQAIRNEIINNEFNMRLLIDQKGQIGNMEQKQYQDFKTQLKQKKLKQKIARINKKNQQDQNYNDNNNGANNNYQQMEIGNNNQSADQNDDSSDPDQD